MPTVKLVIIGASGVGKTSLRGQYISGRFSKGYRATIGADFITKNMPHPSNPAETVTLQIWDTAGQERFSSLSTAFFRGADAALLMFDVNTPSTMAALTKWWAEFRERAPLADEEMEEYCCVVVGNKTDLTSPGTQDGESPVTEEEALRFLTELVPRVSRPPSPNHLAPPQEHLYLHDDELDDEPLAASQATIRPTGVDDIAPPTEPPARSESIAITTGNRHPASSPSNLTKHPLSKSRSHSASRLNYGGTMTTTHTTLTIYHTPSSSFFDVFQSARSSPEPWTSSPGTSAQSSVRSRRMTALSASSSTSTGSVVTITPSLFARESRSASAPITNDTTPEEDPNSLTFNHHHVLPPPPPARGPKLFFTSAKTGEGVKDVFEYIASRVVTQWEYEERMEARQMHMRETSAADTIRLGLDRERRSATQPYAGCCGS